MPLRVTFVLLNVTMSQTDARFFEIINRKLISITTAVMHSMYCRIF